MAPTPIRTISIIQAEQPFPNILDRSVVVMPRYGVPLIATILKNAGYDVTTFVEDIWPINWDILARADVVCFHTLTCAMGRMQRLVEQIRFIRPRVPIIVGGTHSTYYPESVLAFCDYVVRQEGDQTILDLLDALATGRDPASVLGVTFHRDGKTIATPDRPPVETFDTVVDMTTVYGWKDLVTKPGLPFPLLTIQSTRGCVYSCRFCPVKTMFGRPYRKRSIDSVVADLRDKLQYGKFVMFVDNLFDGDPKHTAALLQRMIDERLTADYTVFCRSTISKHPDLLRLMKRAGVSSIFLGVESLNQASLDNADKRQKVLDVDLAIHAIRKAGIRPLTSMIMGFDTDTVESFEFTRKMLRKWHIGQMCIFSLWGGYPHDGELLMPPERWILRDWAYTNGMFVCHFPLRMKPSTLQRQIMLTYDEVFSRRQALRDTLTGYYNQVQWRLFYRMGWRKTRRDVAAYLPYLEELEKPYYDSNENLLVDKLKDRPDLPWIINQLR